MRGREGNEERKDKEEGEDGRGTFVTEGREEGKGGN